jgi:iron(III) transport system ATP-binding protein
MNLKQYENGTLVLEQVTKVFEQNKNLIRAVDDVSLTIRSGEFLTLLGPSGCGKTTTLRLIAGFDFPTSGRLLLDNKDIANLPPNLRPMAMVFQSYALFPHLNVFENVAYGLRLRHMKENEIKESVDIVLHMMNLVGLEKRGPNQLSGGQQQRVALARAMVMKPKVLLFDEPLSNLDAKLRTQMRIEIRQLQQRMGITSIYVTHDQTEAMSLSDRIVIMNKGKIEQVGTPEEIYQRPATVFVADFIGRANFIKTKAISRDSNLAQAEIFGRPAFMPCSDEIVNGSEAYAVIRPEALKLLPENGGTLGEVKTAVYLGSSVEYEVESESNFLIAVDYDPQPGKIFHEGERVSLAFDPKRSYLLPFQK